MGRPKDGYHNAAGERLPGVTTITGRFKESGALIGWAAKTGYAAGWADGRNGTRQRKWTDVLYGERDQAADAGKLAHELFENWLRGNNVEPEDWTDASIETRQRAMQAYENARTWASHTGLTIRPFEEPLVSEALQFGGTPDALASDRDKRLYLADWKTGGLYGEHIVQMAAYAELLAECNGWNIHGAHLVRFPRDVGGFTHHLIDGPTLAVGVELFRLWRKAYDLDTLLTRTFR